ncbi:MAG: hypothetical protein HY332_17390 [Chloroflexi bacterium]|nr:hypothetical protein [Chloroflexota bacterium]
MNTQRCNVRPRAYKNRAECPRSWFLLHRLSEEQGQGMTEYAVLVGLVAVAAVVILPQLGLRVGAVFATAAAALDPGGVGAPGAGAGALAGGGFSTESIVLALMAITLGAVTALSMWQKLRGGE